MKKVIDKLFSKKITKSFFMGVFSTGADLIVYALLNIFLPLRLRDVPLKLFGPFVYEPDIGGLATFISSTAAYGVGSIVSYITQRKWVFKSNTNLRKSSIEFAISTTIMYVFMTYALEIVAPFFASFLGEYIGPFVGRCLSQFLVFLMQFYLNKYVILKCDE